MSKYTKGESKARHPKIKKLFTALATHSSFPKDKTLLKEFLPRL